MLNKVEVRTAQGTLLTLSLADPSNGYLVKDIGGLDPVKATMVSSSFAGLEGEQFQSSRREKRNITMKLGYLPDYSVNSVRNLRNNLYSFFMPQSNVNLRFYVDGLTPFDIVGKVEVCDSPLFAKDPEANISILCFDSDFYNETPVSLSGNTVSTTTTTPIDYVGSLETGMTFTLNVNRSLSSFTLNNTTPDNQLQQLSVAIPLVSGDILKISTTPGAKSVMLTRGSATTSVLYAVSPQSQWLEFKQGVNQFRVYASGAAIPYTLSYVNKYGGL